MRIDPIHILLVEDSPSDVELTIEALRSARVANQLHVVSDGEAAVRFVRREGEWVDAPRPDLILLDLNLPRKDGREVLEELKGDDALALIPVIVLTTSAAEIDVLRSYRLHANSYVVKPVDFDQFIGAVRSIEDFWLSVVKLPNSVMSDKTAR